MKYRFNKCKYSMLSAVLSLLLLLCGCSLPSVFTDTVSDYLGDSTSLPVHVSSSGDTDDTGDAKGNEEDADRVYSGDKYAYNAIDEAARQVYDDMLYAIVSFDESFDSSSDDSSVIKTAYIAIMSDYGGLFWVDGYTIRQYSDVFENVQRTEVILEYTMSEEQKEVYQAKVDEKVEEYLSGISPNDSDYDKALYVYEALINNVDYLTTASENQNILSVFLYSKTVCRGYSCAFSYLMAQLDIPCIIVSGTALGESHAWNIVLLDGEYYCMDVTFGNSLYLSSQDERFVNYGYFAMTDEECDREHTADMPFELPGCSATEDNYFIKEGLYFADPYDEGIDKIISEAYNADEVCMFKFSDDEVYDKAKEDLITNGRVGKICFGLTQIRYIENETMNVLVFEL